MNKNNKQTEDIILNLNELNKSSQELDMQDPERLDMMKSVTNYANEFIAGLDTVKAFNPKEATSLEITNQKKSLPDLLDLYQKKLLKPELMRHRDST